MPLYFTDKKKRWPPPKPVQYIAAVIALVTAVGILSTWLLLRFVYTSPDSDTSPTTGKTTTGITTTTQTQLDLPDNGYCLFIIEDTGYEGFAIIECAPTDNRIVVRPVSPTLPVNEHETVTEIYRRAKAAEVTKAIANHYQLPLDHYITLSISEVMSLITRWCGTLPMTPPEDISYRDENGAVVRLPATLNALTPKQVAEMLRHKQWKDAKNGENLTADLTTALINHILTPSQNLNQLYNDIADDSSIRIHHFNAFYKGLAHLASINDGSIAQRE